MKKLIKYLFIGFLGLIVLGAVASMGEEEAAVSVEEKVVETAEAEKEPAAKEEPKEEASLPGKAEYDAIENGMTREQVEALFGEVDVQLESESEFDNIKTIMVVYGAEGDIGANITVSFTNGEVDSKSNFGVK